MITVLPSDNAEEIRNMFAENGVPYSENAGLVTAKFNEEILGFCLYALDSDCITVYTLSPENDIMLADGILRSALHIAARRKILRAAYGENAPEELFEKLGFVKNKKERTLDISKLFSDCSCKKG